MLMGVECPQDGHGDEMEPRWPQRAERRHGFAPPLRFVHATIRRLMPLEVLQRYAWHGTPVHVGDLFRLHKQREAKRLDAVCRLTSHQLGWELRLEVNGELQRSEVCRSQDAVLDTSDAWKAAMTEKGWL
jgi:hypothetical protein